MKLTKWASDYAPIAIIAVAALVGVGFAHRAVPAQRDDSLASLAIGSRQIVSISNVPTKGSQAARVVAIEFSDFQCPYCIQFASDVLPALESKYVDSGLVRIAFRNMPLVSLHAHALAAASAARCAADQGRFWQFHDSVFKASGRFDDAFLGSLPSVIGLDLQRHDKCLSESAAALVQQDLDSARSLKVNGTPTLFIGVAESSGLVRLLYRIDGKKTWSTITRAFDDVLLEASKPGV